MTRRFVALLLTVLTLLGGTSLFAPEAEAFDRSDRVYLVGDSTLAAVRWYNTLATLAPYDYVLDAESCRRVSGLSCRGREGYAPNNALEALQAHAADLGDTVVAMIGYDDSGTIFGGEVDQFMALAQTLGVKRVVWLTFKTDVSYVGPTFAANDGTYKSNNRILLEKATTYGDRLVIADWNAEGATHPNWFESDGVHLTLAGSIGAGTFIKATLDKVAPGRCSANAKSQGTSPVTPTTSLATAPAGVTVVAPKRLVDTRDGAAVAAETALTVKLDGVVPADATAVIVNLTATDPCASGYLTAYGCKQALPATSNVNVAAAGSRATMAVVPINGEDLCVYSKNRADVVVDLFGYASPSAAERLVPITPARLVDTRSGTGADAAKGKLTPQVPLKLKTSAVNGMPTGATGAVVTLTALAGSAPGWLATFPCDAPSTTSVVNFSPSEIVANSAFVKLAADGSVCVLSNVAVDVVMDVTGWIAPTGSQHEAQAPVRLVDTREAKGGARLDDGAVLKVTIPGNPKGALLSVTAVDSTQSGFITVYACDQPRPLASTLNVNGKDTRANLAVAAANGGQVCIYTLHDADVVVDLMGAIV